jgi:uncharacterized membrane protein
MLKYLIEVIENLLLPAIALGLFIAFLFSKCDVGSSDKKVLKLSVIGGLSIGSLAAAILALLRFTTALVNRELWNIGILSVAILSGIIAIALIWIVKLDSKNKALKIATSIAAFLFIASVMFYAMPDIFLYPTEFVMADGSVFSTDVLFKFIGYAIGLTAIILTTVALYKAAKISASPLYRAIVSSAVFVLLLNYASVIIQLLMARRIIPLSHGLFELIKLTVNHKEYFLYASILLSLVVIVKSWISSRKLKDEYPNPAEKRKDISRGIKSRRWSCMAALGFILAILSLTVIQSISEREVVLSPAEDFDLKGTEISIPVERVEDGRLHRFQYIASDGTGVRFIVIKKNNVSYGVGLDACDICGDTGYYERDDEVICKLCDVVMNKQTIGFKGGCNPVPLTYKLEGGKMVINTTDLENEKNRFR